MKTSRVSRVVQMLTTLHSGPPRSTAELSRIFGVSRRTLFRDLKELQNIGVQPKFSASQQGYQIDHEQFLPPINLNLQEALAILLLAHKMRGQIQLPFKSAALLAALKIESSLPPRIRRYCESTLARITAKATAQAPVPGSPGLDSIFSTLQNAIAQRRKVRICYDSFFDGSVVGCVLSPFHIFYNQRAWYVIAHSSLHKAMRTFKLNRIKKADMLDETFTDGEDFDLAEYIGCAWSMIPEGRIYNVRLRFLPKVAGNVAEVQWHNSQKVQRNTDGTATLEFRVDGINEITWWVLGYGDQVEVLAPAILRKKVRDTALKMAELNGDKSPSLRGP
jgi:predicted DNA-binding transcriptional regulator YafY